MQQRTVDTGWHLPAIRPDHRAEAGPRENGNGATLGINLEDRQVVVRRDPTAYRTKGETKRAQPFEATPFNQPRRCRSTARRRDGRCLVGSGGGVRVPTVAHMTHVFPPVSNDARRSRRSDVGFWWRGRRSHRRRGRRRGRGRLGLRSAGG